MNSILGHLGAAGLAVVLSVLLWFGTKGGGKAKQLGWGMTFFLSMLAGAAFNAAGPPFNLVSALVNDLLALANSAIAGVTQAALALALLAFAAYAKLTTRQVAVIGVILFFLASGSGGVLDFMSVKIADIMQKLAG
ncbi:hypothetical protein ACH4Q7_22570 [Streptomyces roseolus]|uniref:hypothetical protein n=1 Tax=Streptomyces roseolus TaxID=67358 RepID=UPI0037AF4A77